MPLWSLFFNNETDDRRMEKTLPAGAPPKWLGSRGEELKNIVSLLGEGFVKCRANLYNAETNPDVSTQI